jgi:excisionase family DNA binding protein
MGALATQGQTPDAALAVRAVSVQTAARMYGLGRTTLWEAIRVGKLPARRVGRRVLLRLVDLEAWIDGDSKVKPRMK